ncbi:hypothetical protein ACFL10_01790 [Patescibacteria group bacterium]
MKSKRESKWENKWLKFTAIVGLFTILTVILTYPAVFTLFTHFIGDAGDGSQNVWNMWWFKKSVFELGQSPYFTNYLHYPHGTTLLLHSLSPLNMILSLPFGLFLNVEGTYNMIVLFSFVASGVTMFYLAHYLTKSNIGSIGAGIIFSFSAYHFAHSIGHVNLLAIQWFPLFILFYIKLLKEGGFKNSILTGVALILASLSSWFYLVYGAFLGLILFVYYFKDFLKQKKKILLILVALGVFLIAVGPIIFTMIAEASKEPFIGGHPPDFWVADLSSYFLPGRLSSFGGYFEGIWSNYPGNFLETSLFLGYVLMIFGAYALVKVKKARKWGIVALISFILSLGSVLWVFGYKTGIPMPYHFLHRYIPFLDLTGVPARFGFLVNFSFAILFAYAIAHLTKPFLKKVKNKIFRVFVPVCILLLLIIENLSVPYPVIAVDIPDFYYQMQSDQEQYSVLEVPMDGRTLYMATIHQKPLIGGYISKMPLSRREFLLETPIISSLYSAANFHDDGNYSETENIKQLANEIFEKYDIKYVIIKTDEHLEFLRDTLELDLVYDKEMKVFDTGIEPLKANLESAQ